MKRFKQIDLIIQGLLVGGSFLYYMSGQDFTFYPYFIVGGWQLLSCLVHLIGASSFLASGERKQYLQTLCWIFVFTIISIAIPLFLFFGFALLLVSPVMAIWYILICYSEYRNLKAREFIHLK